MNIVSFKDLVIKAKEVHGDRYDYPEQGYKGANSKVRITCRIHGDFYQNFYSHFKTKGCPLCGKPTMIDFIDKAKKIHGDTYEYPEQEYLSAIIKIKIKCKVHGEFYQTPNSHLRGYGCQRCANIGVAKLKKNPWPKTLGLFKKIHGDRYDYFEQDYDNCDTLLRIQCKVHGVFYQSADNHTQGKGCTKCGIEKRASSKRYSWDEAVALANTTHDNKYVYPKQPYKTTSDPIQIICPTHGTFTQHMVAHIGGKGCSVCGAGNISYSEINLSKSLSENNVINSYRLETKNVIKNGIANKLYTELDMYFPDKNIAVEYNGIYWHSEERVGKSYHNDKRKACLYAGIGLIQIFEDEWLTKPDIVKSIINTRLGTYEKRVFARKTKLVQATPIQAAQFYENNHIQGRVGATNHYALTYDGELIACASFGVRSSIFKNANEVELIRFCTKLNTQVIGGLSKLLAVYRNSNIKTFCDLRLFTGHGYASVGFKVLHESSPGYYYVKGRKRYSRFQFQKHKLEKQLENYDPLLTEVENMKNNGYHRIFDCGNLVLIRPAKP